MGVSIVNGYSKMMGLKSLKWKIPSRSEWWLGVPLFQETFMWRFLKLGIMKIVICRKIKVGNYPSIVSPEMPLKETAGWSMFQFNSPKNVVECNSWIALVPKSCQIHIDPECFASCTRPTLKPAFGDRTTVSRQKKGLAPSGTTQIWRFPEIGGTPKSSILIGFSDINHPFWETPLSGKPHMANIGQPFWRSVWPDPAGHPGKDKGPCPDALPDPATPMSRSIVAE